MAYPATQLGRSQPGGPGVQCGGAGRLAVTPVNLSPVPTQCGRFVLGGPLAVPGYPGTGSNVTVLISFADPTMAVVIA